MCEGVVRLMVSPRTPRQEEPSSVVCTLELPLQVSRLRRRLQGRIERVVVPVLITTLRGGAELEPKVSTRCLIKDGRTYVLGLVLRSSKITAASASVSATNHILELGRGIRIVHLQSIAEVDIIFISP